MVHVMVAIVCNDLGLQPALQEVLDLEAEHVIELHPVVAQDSSPEIRILEEEMHLLGG